MRVWTPCEVWRHARLAVTYASRCAPLASYSHVRAWPPVLRLRGFPQPCFPSLLSRLPYLLRLYSRSLCSQLFDSPQLCSRWPCSPSLLSQWPCSLRPYFRWPLSRSRGPPPALREQRFLALAWDGR